MPGVGIFDEFNNDVLAHIEGGTIKIMLPSAAEDKVYAVYTDNKLLLTSNGSLEGYSKFTIHAEGLEAIEYEYEGELYIINVIRADGNTVRFEYEEARYE
jgi:hypothetical protein